MYQMLIQLGILVLPKLPFPGSGVGGVSVDGVSSAECEVNSLIVVVNEVVVIVVGSGPAVQTTKYR